MKRNLIKIYLHLPNHLSSSIATSISLTPNPNLPKNSRQPPLHTFFKQSINTSSTDQLEGLIDPHFNSPDNRSNPQIASEKNPNLEEEFAILQGSLSVEKIESCKYSDAYIICKAVRDNKLDFGDKTHKFLAKFREKLSESLVVDVLKLLPNAELGVKFFIWAGRQIGYNHTLAVYDALLDVMRCDNDNIPDDILREIKDDDDEVLGKLLNVLIRKYCRNGSWNVAIEELSRLKAFGYKASRVTYNALVQVFLEAGRLDSADLVYREMVDVGYEMDAHTLGSFAYSLCKIGKWRDALDMVKRGKTVADTVLYTRMIGGLCEGSYFEEAMEFLNRMRCDSCCPNVITYRTLLCGCLNKGKLGRCKMILSMMIAEGCYPSPKIYNSLVHAYCKSGDFSYAYKLVKETGKYGVRPGHVIYNIFIGGICGKNEMPSDDNLNLAEMAYGQMIEGGFVLNKVNVTNYAQCLCVAGKFEKAYSVIQEMMKNGFVPDNSTYNKVISFLCGASKFEKAFWLFKEMKKNGVVPNVHTYTMLIDTFCKAGLIPHARTWFDEMVANGVLIHHCCASGRLDEAHGLLEEMKMTYWPKHMASYRKVIEGFNREFLINIGLLDDISEYDFVPVIPVYKLLFDSYRKAGKLEVALELLKEVSSLSSSIDKDLYFSMIESLLVSHRVEKAFELYADMISKGGVPEFSVMVNLVKGLVKVNRWEEAIQLSHSLCYMDIQWLSYNYTNEK
ncbi:putative tetratricopeptide-like helical domain superfamily [Helianthus annuus]|nr:putative tetratricopeptide-like helical domain superfamily [Helianthus annuus]